jgi:hypothetical protein
LNRGHFLPGERTCPRAARVLIKMFSSADDISIALAIAGDRKHLWLAVAPLVLTASEACSGGASDRRQNPVFPTPDIRSVALPPTSPRSGSYAEVLASPPFILFKPASQGLNLSTTKWRLAETPSDRLMATSPSKNDEDDVLSIFTQNLGRLMPTCMNSLYASKALEYRIMCSNRLLVTPRSGIARGTQYTLANDPSFVSADGFVRLDPGPGSEVMLSHVRSRPRA